MPQSEARGSPVTDVRQGWPANNSAFVDCVQTIYHHCHSTTDDLRRRAADFETRLNQEPYAVADRLWVKDYLDPDEEKLRFSK